jgi:hypothetical protein
VPGIMTEPWPPLVEGGRFLRPASAYRDVKYALDDLGGDLTKG